MWVAFVLRGKKASRCIEVSIGSSVISPGVVLLPFLLGRLGVPFQGNSVQNPEGILVFLASGRLLGVCWEFYVCPWGRDSGALTSELKCNTTASHYLCPRMTVLPSGVGFIGGGSLTLVFVGIGGQV